MTAPRGAHLLLLLLAVAAAAVFARVWYTPDEPREASLVASMLESGPRALPSLDGRPFAEKPPLLYWLGAASAAAFGSRPAAVRLPNLGYLLLTGLALAALARRAAGEQAGFAAGVVAVTALTPFQALVWLATDAPLLAGVALSLLGSYRALTAVARPGRWQGYALMHAGLLIAFFAKGPAGWLVPLSAYATVVLAERRWRELLRIELWAYVPLQAVAIGAWALWLAAEPGGEDSLKVLFWYNLVGRAVRLAAPAGADYASGHRNWPGKYLLELPLYLLPWSALLVAALRRALKRARLVGAEGSGWRLALGASVPPGVVLSLAATARGVYFAPVALGCALLIGLYVGASGTAVDRFERICWRLTQLLTALLAAVLGLAALAAAAAPAWREPATLALGAVSLAAAALALRLALAPRVAAAGLLPRLAAATALSLSLVMLPLYVQLNGWLSLETLAARLSRAAAARPLVLLDPDETTLAMTQLYLPRAAVAARVAAEDPERLAHLRAALALAGPVTRVLWLLPGGARWTLGDWSAFLGYSAGAHAPKAAPLPLGLEALVPECVATRPGGRSYVLYRQAAAAGVPAAASAPRCP